jgi:hypothetical protein
MAGGDALIAPQSSKKGAEAMLPAPFLFPHPQKRF